MEFNWSNCFRIRFLAMHCCDNVDDANEGSYVELYCGSWDEYILEVGVDNSDEPFVIWVCDVDEVGNDLNWLNFWLLISFNKCSFVVTNDLNYFLN